MKIDQGRIERAVAACEDAYLRCFCAAEKVGPLTRYRDAKLPDMHFHNCTLIPREAYGNEGEWAALCQGEVDHRRKEGASFCKLSLSQDPTGILGLLQAPGKVTVEHFGHYFPAAGPLHRGLAQARGRGNPQDHFAGHGGGRHRCG